MLSRRSLGLSNTLWCHSALLMTCCCYVHLMHSHGKMSEGIQINRVTWWHHQMETFSVLLALCAGNSPVTGEFPSQRPVKWSFDVFFNLRLNKRLSKPSWGWWFETSSRSLWRHTNEIGSFKCTTWEVLQRSDVTTSPLRKERKEPIWCPCHDIHPTILLPSFTTVSGYFNANLIIRFMGPTWGPTGAYGTQVGSMLASWTLLSA